MLVATVQVKNRILNKVSGGVIAFGAAPAPIVLYTGPTGRRALTNSKTAAVAVASLATRSGTHNVGEEENSSGNVNRGDTI